MYICIYKLPFWVDRLLRIISRILSHQYSPPLVIDLNDIEEEKNE